MSVNLYNLDHNLVIQKNVMLSCNTSLSCFFSIAFALHHTFQFIPRECSDRTLYKF